jgi:cytochrome c oxidase assembly protein subunit 15
VLAQGSLGGLQYVFGVPEVLVSLHVLGACLTTAAAAALWAASTDRPPVPAVPAVPSGTNGAPGASTPDAATSSTPAGSHSR